MLNNTLIISASDAKREFGKMIDLARDKQKDIVVESYGEPAIVILSYSEYAEIEEVREYVRRQNALKRLRALKQSVQEQGTGQQCVSDDAAERIANRAVKESIDEMIEDGAISYEQQKNNENSAK